MIKKGMRFLIIAAVVSVQLSCTLWSARQWDELTDRKFYFQRFTYYLKGGNREKAFAFMRDFPVKEMLCLLSEKHDIEIDSSEYEAFISGEENRKKLKAFGILIKERFRWEASMKQANSVELVYANEFAYESEPVRTYSVRLRVNGRLRASYGDSIENREGVIRSLRLKLRIVKGEGAQGRARSDESEEPKSPRDQKETE